MIKSAVITECWTPQSSHHDTFFSIYTCWILRLYIITCDQDGSLSTTVYQKKTHRQVPGLHITSLPITVMNALQSRAKTHCTFVNDRTAEENHITSALRVNNYPEMITSRIGCIIVLKPPNDLSPTPPSQWFTIPYINNISDSIRRISS